MTLLAIQPQSPDGQMDESRDRITCAFVSQEAVVVAALLGVETDRKERKAVA